MATVQRDVRLEASPDAVWDAVRDVGAVHERLARGFVVDTKLEDDGEARVVTFVNGMVVREPIVSVDDDRRRLAWSAEGGRTTHYNAALEVAADGTGTRLTWTADLLPHEMAEPIAALMEQGLAAVKATLDGP